MQVSSQADPVQVPQPAFSGMQPAQRFRFSELWFLPVVSAQDDSYIYGVESTSHLGRGHLVSAVLLQQLIVRIVHVKH